MQSIPTSTDFSHELYERMPFDTQYQSTSILQPPPSYKNQFTKPPAIPLSSSVEQFQTPTIALSLEGVLPPRPFYWESNPLPSSFGPAPSSFGPAPSSVGPAPSSFGPAPSSFGPTPSSFGPAPSSFGPTPSSFGPAPSSFGPAPSPFGQAMRPPSDEHIPPAHHVQLFGPQLDQRPPVHVQTIIAPPPPPPPHFFPPSEMHYFGPSQPLGLTEVRDDADSNSPKAPYLEQPLVPPQNYYSRSPPSLEGWQPFGPIASVDAMPPSSHVLPRDLAFPLLDRIVGLSPYLDLIAQAPYYFGPYGPVPKPSMWNKIPPMPIWKEPAERPTEEAPEHVPGDQKWIGGEEAKEEVKSQLSDQKNGEKSPAAGSIKTLETKEASKGGIPDHSVAGILASTRRGRSISSRKVEVESPQKKPFDTSKKPLQRAMKRKEIVPPKKERKSMDKHIEIKARVRSDAIGRARWKTAGAEYEQEEVKRFHGRRKLLDKFESRMYYHYELPTVCKLIHCKIPELFLPPCLSTTPEYEFASEA